MMYTHDSSLGPHFLAFIVVAISLAFVHLCSDILHLIRDPKTTSLDYNSSYLVSMRLVSLIAGIVLLDQGQETHWINFCVLASILFLLADESLGRIHITQQKRLTRYVCVLINTVSTTGVRYFSAAASLELHKFALFIFGYLFIEYAYSLLYVWLSACPRKKWPRRFDLLRQGLCCATMCAALIIASIYRRWYSTILVVSAMACSFFSLPFYRWITACGSLWQSTQFVCPTAAAAEAATPEQGNTLARGRPGWTPFTRLKNSNSTQPLRTATSFGDVAPEHTTYSASQHAHSAHTYTEANSKMMRPPPGFLGTMNVREVSTSPEAESLEALPVVPVDLPSVIYVNDVVYPDNNRYAASQRWM